MEPLLAAIIVHIEVSAVHKRTYFVIKLEFK